jgi:hypothetical protein
LLCQVYNCQTASERLERHADALKTLAERALALACAVQERALTAETGAEMAELSMAFHRISRTLRQCLALEAKLVRDAERAAREALAEAEREGVGRARRRKDQLRTVLRREILAAVGEADEDDEDDIAGTRLEHLESLLDEDELSDDFLALPVPDQIARLRYDLGLAEAAVDEIPQNSSVIPGLVPGTQTHDGFRRPTEGAAPEHPPNSS